MGQISFIQITVMSFLLITSVKLVTGQISTPCTTSMISSFTPCANYITGSINNNNGLITPSTSCCDSFNSLMSNSMDCACLLVSANVPFQLLPINRVLSFFLPQACNFNGFSVQCKASGSPLPAPGPAILGSNVPTLPPINASPFSPQVTKTVEVADAPRNVIPHSSMAHAPMKQSGPRKLQQFNKYF